MQIVERIRGEVEFGKDGVAAATRIRPCVWIA
jgi:hypothetical protein